MKLRQQFLLPLPGLRIGAFQPSRKFIRFQTLMETRAFPRRKTFPLSTRSLGFRMAPSDTLMVSCGHQVRMCPPSWIGRLACLGLTRLMDVSSATPPDAGKYALYVRGNENVGVNDFVAENTNVVTDQATGLQWMRQDSGGSMDWPTALEYCEQLDFDGASDWRLPNAHELQSIVDYSRSPDTTNSAALGSIFDATSIVNEVNQEDFGWYWTSTTHLDGTKPGDRAVYIAFGRALGNMTTPNGYRVMDVHGAGAQRSDPKSGENRWPYGHGPQGDIVRINNFVRCVRVESSSSPAPEEPAQTEPTGGSATHVSLGNRRASFSRFGIMVLLWGWVVLEH